MSTPTIVAVRALVPAEGGGADYHAQAPGHWIASTKVANPMSVYPRYRAERTSWGMDAAGSVVVELEADDGTVGFAPSVGGMAAAIVVERHLERFLVGRRVDAASIAEAWDQMYRATMFYGRRGLVLNAISAVDLALWDLLGVSRREPVWHLLGGKRTDPLRFYATTPRPDVARSLGFVGGKIPLPACPAEGVEALEEDLALATAMRARCGTPEDFFLAWDCYMSLDVEFAVALGTASHEIGFRWLEEPLPPDDYWGHREIAARLPAAMELATGEHEGTRWGFRMLLEHGPIDIVQPDVSWCGGLSELLQIAALADEHGAYVIPHASSVYAYHFATSRPRTPFAEFLMMHHDGTEITPMFAPLLLGEPVPTGGLMSLSDAAGFGVELNRDLQFDRPPRRARGADG